MYSSSTPVSLPSYSLGSPLPPLPHSHNIPTVTQTSWQTNPIQSTPSPSYSSGSPLPSPLHTHNNQATVQPPWQITQNSSPNTASGSSSTSYEFEVVFSEGDKLLSLVQHLASFCSQGTFRFGPTGIKFGSPSTLLSEYFEFELFQDGLLEYRYNTQVIKTMNLQAIDYDPVNDVRSIGLDFEDLATKIRGIGKNQIYFYKPSDSNVLLLGMRKKAGTMQHQCVLIPVMNATYDISRPNTRPNCKVTGDAMKTLSTSVKHEKSESIVISYGVDNLYITRRSGGGLDSWTNPLYYRDGDAAPRTSLPPNINTVTVSVNYFTKSFPRLCDIVGSSIMSFYMDAEKYGQRAGSRTQIPLEVQGNIGGMGDFKLYLYDARD